MEIVPGLPFDQQLLIQLQQEIQMISHNKYFQQL